MVLRTSTLCSFTLLASAILTSNCGYQQQSRFQMSFLPPAPRQEACTHCDFRPVCGPYEQERWQRDKEQAPLAALVALRERP